MLSELIVLATDIAVHAACKQLEYMVAFYSTHERCSQHEIQANCIYQ